MKITNRILSILIVLLMLLNTVTVFAATDSYDAGYDAGYDYGFDYTGRQITGRTAYNSNYRDSRAHRNIIRDMGDDYEESEFRDGFIDGFNDGYDADFDDDAAEVDYASQLGKLLGGIYGERDFQNSIRSDWKKALPSTSEVRRMFNLDRQTTAYANSFISAFNSAFNDGYVEAYENAMFEPAKITMEQGFKDGEDSGWNYGAAYGAKDYHEGNFSSFKRDLLTKFEIVSEYSLNNHSNEYEDGFIAGFISAYEEGYNEAFRGATLNEGLKKITSEVIPIIGSEVVTGDGRFAVKIPSGIYYHDVNLIISTSYDAGDARSGNLIKSSDSYNVKIVNSSGNVDDGKSIEVSFEFHGDKAAGGIYRQSGNQWLYVPTVIEDGMMKAKVNPARLTSYGTTYSAFVDKNFTVLTDARGHWASDEIDAFVRRGIISGYSDNTFRPDNYITRAEFLTLVSKVYNWNTSWYYSSSAITYNDSDIFGSYNHVIYYASYHNIIYGYSDGYFRPNNLITYSEVEAIMGRVRTGTFRWANTANDMLYEKKVRSNSFNSLNNNITRAEVAYMLYNLTE